MKRINRYLHSSRFRIFLVLFCPLFFLIGGENAHGTTLSDNTREIVDMLGRRIQVAANLDRVALLGGPTGQVPFIVRVRHASA